MVKILTEEKTLEVACGGVSLSRFGDGELRVATGGTCYGQREKNPRLTRELATILRSATPGLMVCIPNYGAPGPNKSNWEKYAAPAFMRLYGKQVYGSAFITRPDSAPWIDKPAYWNRVKDLWRGKDVTLVYGSRKSLTDAMLIGDGCAKSVTPIVVTEAEAYRDIDATEEMVGKPSGPVLMCAGVMATVLAWRLAKKGVHALDLGHIGMFMKHAGAYAYQPDQLSSAKYRSQLHKLHNQEKWGGDGKKHAVAVADFASSLGAKSILDYGCGRATLGKVLNTIDFLGVPYRMQEYDPGVEGKTKLPKPADLVVCTDVLEHVEPEKVEAVLRHLYTLSGLGAYFTIATRPANMVLPNGKNAHLTLRSCDWWIGMVANAGFNVSRTEVKEGHEVALWLTR